ncbi:MAG: ATP-binding cassette domain-containing protein [Rhizobiales bacterium]|nr:ATP-binding cassette domain-containing protein [Hyphomicrobiales bacterium]
MTSPTAMIALDGVRLTLSSKAGPVEILRGIDLEVTGGEAVGVVGPSGSGKTSLLMLMAGLERASSGRIAVDGHDLAGLDEDARARLRGRRIGVVFQSFHLVPSMTALENVALPLEFAGAERAIERAESALAEVGLSHRIGHFPAQLSGGEQQRVALARALVVEPALLLADEPTGNLDAATGEAIVELLFRLRDRHRATLVLVTHDHDLAARCPRVLEMGDGRIVADRRREELVR